MQARPPEDPTSRQAAENGDPYAASPTEPDSFKPTDEYYVIGTWVLGAACVGALVSTLFIALLPVNSVGWFLTIPLFASIAAFFASTIQVKRVVEAVKTGRAQSFLSPITAMSALTHVFNGVLWALFLGLTDRLYPVGPVNLVVTPAFFIAVSFLIGGTPNMIFDVHYRNHLERRFTH